MPLYQVEAKRTSLLSLQGLVIDVGDHDDFSHIRMGSRLFSDALAERDIPHVFEIYADGDHGNRIAERLKRALRFFAETLQQEP
jgi:S-formylglutathione hydrolase FrmB